MDKFEELYRMLEEFLDGASSQEFFLVNLDDYICQNHREMETINPRAYKYLADEVKQLFRLADQRDDSIELRKRVQKMYDELKAMHHRQDTKACCPSCRSCARIMYLDLGDRQRIYCAECGLMYTDKDARKLGFDNVIDYWEHIGVYMPQD